MLTPATPLASKRTVQDLATRGVVVAAPERTGCTTPAFPQDRVFCWVWAGQQSTQWQSRPQGGTETATNWYDRTQGPLLYPTWLVLHLCPIFVPTLSYFVLSHAAVVALPVLLIATCSFLTTNVSCATNVS